MKLAKRVSLAGIVAMMAGSGMIHLLSPRFYVKAVPRALGHAEFLVFWSGVAELALAALLLIPRTRKVGGWLTALFLIAVFPANLQMALDGPEPGGNWFTGSATALWLRLPVQPFLIYWAWTFARDRSDSDSDSGAGVDVPTPSSGSTLLDKYR